MVKSNELRIGNLLASGIVVKVEKDFFTINDGYQDWRSDKMIQEWIDSQPILLKEEVLLDCGFEYVKRKSGTQGVYSNGKMNVHISNSGNIYRINKLIPYVHKLQNLHFELYDEELEFKTLGK